MPFRTLFILLFTVVFAVGLTVVIAGSLASWFPLPDRIWPLILPLTLSGYLIWHFMKKSE